MDARHTIDARLIPTYEALLTTLCQCGLASTWGWWLPVADPDAARSAVVTWALAFGDPIVRSLAVMLEQHVDRLLIEAPLVPIVCRGRQLDGVLHVTTDTMKLSDQLDGKDAVVWDAGHGSRIGRLLQPGQAKGEVEIVGDHKLYEFAAGAAQWLVSTLRALNRDYVAFVAADQILCLSKPDERELATLLDTASSHDTDVIFFDGPPALSLLRLRFLLDSNQPPRRDGAMALTRDRQMLKNYGGAHVFQGVLLKRNHAPALVTALEAVLDATRKGCDVDLGVGDIVVLPRLIAANWLKKQPVQAFRAIQAAICGLCARARRVRSVSMPLQVFNVNTPGVLSHLKERIRCEEECGVSRWSR